AFDTPDGATGKVNASSNIFPLYASRALAEASSYTRRIELIAYFPGSVAGLTTGSEVTLRGLKVGEVTDVRLSFDEARDALVSPVRLAVEPERIVGIGRRIAATTEDGLKTLVEQGLRATLQSSNLITGQMQLALDFVPGAPPATIEKQGDLFVVP